MFQVHKTMSETIFIVISTMSKYHMQESGNSEAVQVKFPQEGIQGIANYRRHIYMEQGCNGGFLSHI
jgi:hypothetical protein